MVVNGKFVTYDLSRFSNCQLKRSTICDLMQIPAFVDALEHEQEFDISDAWIANIANELTVSMRMTKEEKASLTEDEIKLRKRWQAFASNAARLEKKILVGNE